MNDVTSYCVPAESDMKPLFRPGIAGTKSSDCVTGLVGPVTGLESLNEERRRSKRSWASSRRICDRPETTESSDRGRRIRRRGRVVDALAPEGLIRGVPVSCDKGRRRFDKLSSSSLCCRSSSSSEVMAPRVEIEGCVTFAGALSWYSRSVSSAVDCTTA
jgi:hypothetical protein